MPKQAFLRKAALLLFVGLLVQIFSISAQEELSFVDEPMVIVDPLRAAELAMTFDEDPPPFTPAAGPSTWAVVRMVLVLALAALAIYGVVFFIKRISRPSAAIDPFLKTLASVHLGSNRYVHIVSVGSKAWLLGSSDGGVNLISEVEDADVVNAMLLEDSRKTAESPAGRIPDFLTILRRLGTPAGGSVAGADELRKRRERLKGM